MITDINEVKRLQTEKRRESSRESAEAWKARSEADRTNGWNKFKREFCGAGAVARGEVYFDCKANEDLIELFLDVEELPVTYDTILLAFRETRKQLAPFPKQQQYERKTDASKSRIAPQQRSFAPPDKAAPYLRSELIAMTKTQLQNAIKIYGLRSINNILSSTN